MPRYDIILMDADGTLLDFGRAETYAFQRTMASYGLDGGSETHLLYHVINEGLWKKLERGEIDQESLKTERFRLLFERLGVTVNCEAFGRDFLLALGECGDIIAGADQLCKTLRAADCRLYIATNGVADTQHKRLALSGLQPYILEMFISEELGCQKPKREYFDKLFARLGNPARSRAILLGDSLTSDMTGGRNAGIATCWFNPYHLGNSDPSRCDSEIHSLDAFLPIVF